MTISRNFAGGTYRFEVPITYPICPATPCRFRNASSEREAGRQNK